MVSSAGHDENRRAAHFWIDPLRWFSAWAWGRMDRELSILETYWHVPFLAGRFQISRSPLQRFQPYLGKPGSVSSYKRKRPTWYEGRVPVGVSAGLFSK